MRNIAPISGWALDYIVALDRLTPGICGSYFRFSDERRQVVAAVLAQTRLPQDPSVAATLSRSLLHDGHVPLLTRAFRCVPEGLRNTLSKVGHEPQPRAFYGELFDILAKGGPRARVLRQLTRNDFPKLRIVKQLPVELCSAQFVELVDTPQQAAQIREVFELLQQGEVDVASMAAASKAVRSSFDLSEFWRRWAMKCSFPEHPVPASARYSPIQNGEELKHVALRFQNCARRYLVEALSGSLAFGEFHHVRQDVIVKLSKKGVGWALDGIYAKSNGAVCPIVRSSALRYLAEFQITAAAGPAFDSPWRSLSRLTRTASFFEVEWA